MSSLDVVVIGGGQAGLALGFYLRRTSLSYRILDAQPGPGGAWRHTWRSLRLFSPARFSSLPGWVMEGGPDYYPTRDEALDYLSRYEERYGIQVDRPVRVRVVRRQGEELVVDTDRGTLRTHAVVSATGTWERPHVPDYHGRDEFEGVQLHSGSYVSPEGLAGMRVLVIGGGNSGAQIHAELSRVADSTWVTRREPLFLPDHIDGRYLFEEATERWRAHQEGRPAPPHPRLGDIVMVPEVREARARGALESVRPFVRVTREGVEWPHGREEKIDALVWATGFRPVLEHLRPLGVIEENGRVLMQGNRAVREPALWLVGYGDWTGFASATLIAVGRSARAVVLEVAETLARTA